MATKRSRSFKACVRCHNRKVKCDVSISNPCSNCSISQSDCIIYERKKRRKAVPLDTSQKNNKEDAKLLSNDDNLNNLSDVGDISPTTPFQGSFLKPNIQQNYPHLSQTYLDPSVLFKEDMEDVMKFDLNGDSNPMMKTVFQNSINMITENKRTRSYTLDQMDFDVLNMFGCLTLPDDKTCWKYIDSYFNTINTQYPIINKKRFYHDYKDLRNPPSILLLNSIFFLASWNMVVPTLETGQTIQISEIFFKRAKLIYDYGIETNPIPLIQSLLCFCFHSDNMSSLSKDDCYWTKTAITVAYQYEFHQMPTSNDLYERQIRIRLWWMLVTKDRITALGFSKPPGIGLNHDLVRPLQICDLEDSDMSLLEKNYFIQLSRLVLVLGKIIQKQGEINRLHAQGKSILELIKNCDNLMIEYLEGVPNELKLKLNDKSTHSFLSILLSSNYYFTLILIHKANILRKTVDNYPSWAISFQASQIIKASIDCLAKKNMIGQVAFFPHNLISSSAIIMMYHLYNEDESVSKIADNFFLKILSIWSHSCKKWRVCYPYLCVFGQIYKSDKIKKSLLNSVTNNDKAKSSVNAFNSSDLSIVFNSKATVDGTKLKTSTKVSDFGVDFDKLFTDKVFSNEESGEPDLDFIKNSKSKLFQEDVKTGQHGEKMNNNKRKNNKSSDSNQKHDLLFSNGEVPNLAQQTPYAVDEDLGSVWMLQKDWQPKFNFDAQFNSDQQNVLIEQYPQQYIQQYLPINAETFDIHSQNLHPPQQHQQQQQQQQQNQYQQYHQQHQPEHQHQHEQQHAMHSHLPSHGQSIPPIYYQDVPQQVPLMENNRGMPLQNIQERYVEPLTMPHPIPQQEITQNHNELSANEACEYFVNPFSENNDPFAFFKAF